MPQHPDRVWRLQGAANFRDLGGYLGHGGRPLRWRKLFRSDHLAGLTPADQAQLAPLQIARTFDLRGVAERAAAPYELAGATQHSLAIEPTVVQRLHEIMARGRTVSPALVSDLMHELYNSLAHKGAVRFAELFEHLLHNDSPAMIHCTAGKDRTGVACALILLALGVPRPLVLQDYLLTNALVPHTLPDGGRLPPEVLQVLLTVRTSFLDTTLQLIDREPGGFEGYLQQRLGLSRAARDTLAVRYLQAS
jgi:protein-tyrosine phosphatase